MNVALPDAGAVAKEAAPPPPPKRFTRPMPSSAVNSESSMPILRSRHSMASDSPVVSAILGMWPSICVRGSRV